MKIFYVVDEAAPLFKIGGLGDVGGSLPKALKARGTDISLIIPKHPTITIDESWHVTHQLDIIYDNQTLPVSIWRGVLPQSEVPTYLIEESNYISQNTDASDNHADKFAVFCLAVSQWFQTLPENDKPSIVHLNDWHTALIPLIDKHILGEHNRKYIMSIHNLMYQSITTTPVLEKMRLPKDACQIASWDGLDYNINLLLEGLLHVNAITTVSQRYAKEILTDEYGEKINEILATRGKYITGIVNGLDLESFNPETDVHIYQKFSKDSVASGKTANKVGLQAELGLPVNDKSTLVSYVGRVDPRQKGIEIIVEALKNRTLIQGDQQFVFLGTGDTESERLLHEASSGYQNVIIITRYDEPLARKIYAASDYLIIPSKFEPCGLIQMIANRYGGLPVARETGGLADTIEQGVNGFIFKEYTPQAMVNALQGAINEGQDEGKKAQMIQNAMNKDYSWDASAKKYQALYETIASE